jgi:hypothetical protein
MYHLQRNTSGVAPETYTACMLAAVKARKPEEVSFFTAEFLVGKGLLSRPSEALVAVKDEGVWNALVCLLAALEEDGRAYSLIESLLQEGYTPSDASLIAVIRCSHKEAEGGAVKMDMIVGLVEKVKKLGGPVELQVYEELLNAAEKNEATDVAMRFLLDMATSGVAISKACFSSAIRLLEVCNRLAHAHQLWNAMRSLGIPSHDPRPMNEVANNCFLRMAPLAPDETGRGDAVPRQESDWTVDQGTDKEFQRCIETLTTMAKRQPTKTAKKSPTRAAGADAI